MIRTRCCLVLLAALVGLGAGARSGRCQSPDDDIKRHKADQLYSLSAVVRSSIAPNHKKLIIGVLGPDPFTGVDAAGRTINHLDRMVAASNARTGKKQRRPIVVSRFETADEYTPCHILVVSPLMGVNPGDTPAARLAAASEIAVRTKKDKSPVLLVADQPGAARQGVPLSFYLARGSDGSLSVHLEFNPDTAAEHGFDKVDPGFYALLQQGRGRIVR